MRIFDIDGPLMTFLGNAFDFFMIFILTVLLCVPVITGGAALTAAQYVGMKIIRKEAPKVFSSYFKSFKDNFRQSTLLWLIQVVIIGVVLFDWSYVLQLGWGNVQVVYRAFLVIATCLVLFVNMTMYAIIARFEMKGRDVMKTAFILSMTNFPFLAIVLLAVGITLFLCLWFFNLLPAFFVIGFTATTALHAFIMTRALGKLEKKMLEIREEEAEQAGNN